MMLKQNSKEADSTVGNRSPFNKQAIWQIVQAVVSGATWERLYIRYTRQEHIIAVKYERSSRFTAGRL